MRTNDEIMAGGFVDDGAVVVRELGFEGMIAPIPDEESAVAALVPGRQGRVFGLTKGQRAHLFAYNDFPVENCVIKLGAVAENTSMGGLVCGSSGMIYGVASGEQPDGKGPRTVLFRHDSSRDAIGGELTLSRGKPEMLPCPFESSRIRAFVMDAARDVIYGLLAPHNVLFSYEPATGKFAERATLGDGRISKMLCVADGFVYGIGEEGKVFRYAPDKQQIEQTDMVLPCGKGKEYVNEASALVCDPATDVLYGGTFVDGYLFKLILKTGQVVCLGKPIDQRPIRCLTVGKDGSVYGIAGDPGKGICHLFRYNPRSGDLRDLGIPRATIVKSWIAHEIDAICANRSGHIVMGENDRMSHLLVYYPPVGST